MKNFIVYFFFFLTFKKPILFSNSHVFKIPFSLIYFYTLHSLQDTTIYVYMYPIKMNKKRKRRGISNEFVKALIDTEELCRRGTSEIIGRSRRGLCNDVRRETGGQDWKGNEAD